MNFKRRLHLLVVGLLMAAALSACGDPTATTPPAATTAAATTAAATTAAATTAAATTAATTAAATTAASATTASATTAAATTAAPAATTAAATTAAATAAAGGSSDLIENVKFDGTTGKKGGTFVYSFAGQFPTNLQPYYVSQVVASTTWRQIYATLIGSSDNSKYYAYLATQVPTTENGGVKLSADGKTMDVTIKLKPGLKWSDGTPLTSKDIAFTHKWIVDPDNSSLVIDTAQWKVISAVETPDDNTAVLKYNQVYGPYLNFLDGFAPLPEKVWSKISVKNQEAAKSIESTKPSVTSGPMKVEEFVAGDRVVLARNDNFSPVWGFNAYLDKVINRKTADSNASIAAVTKGDIDHGENLDENQFEAAAKVPNAKADIVQQFSYELLQYNLTNPIFQDKNVRKAIAMGLDLPAVIKQFRTPKTQQLAVGISPLSAFYDKANAVPKYDLEGAKKLLDDAGWKAGSDGIRAKDGKKLAFGLSTTTASIRKATAEVFIAYWKEMGADVKLVTYETELFAPWAADGILARGKYDVAMFGFVTGVDPDGSYANFHSSAIPTDANNGNGSNYGRINDKALDKTLDDQRATVDLSKRKEAWTTWQKIMVDNSYITPLYTRVTNYVQTNKIKNFRANPTSNTNFWNIVEVWLDK